MALELHDDHETFAAALALIDEWELELAARDTPRALEDDAHSTSTASNTDSDDTTPSDSDRPVSRRRKARSDECESAAQAQMGRREELVFLRRKVRELEGTLGALRDGSDTVKTESKDVMHEQWAKELDATWIWQQIASRQLEHRQRSERENLRLRVQVEEQLKIAKDLMRLLLRAYNRAENESSEADAHAFKRVKLPRDATSEISEEEQVRRVGELLEESATTFLSAPFTGGPPVFRDVKVLEHANGESTINVDNSWVVPFPVDQVMSTFWTHLMRKSRVPGGPNQECGVVVAGGCPRADDGSELLVTKYESNATATKLMGKFYGRFVARRRHAEGNEPGIIIMDKCADPVGFKPMSMEGVRLQNQTIMRVAWVDQVVGGAHTSSSVGRMSVVQMSQRIQVQLAASDTPTRRRRVGVLTNFFMYNVESELDWKQDLLEMLLMRSTPCAPLASYSR